AVTTLCSDEADRVPVARCSSAAVGCCCAGLAAGTGPADSLQAEQFGSATVPGVTVVVITGERGLRTSDPRTGPPRGRHDLQEDELTQVRDDQTGADEVRMIDRGADPERFARGWHLIGLARDFRDGKPHQVNAFGGKMVVWEDTKGNLNVIDSYCRHMGGDLSQGTIKGDEIACPFHDWRWGGDGRCKDIPYAKRVPMRARTQRFPTLVRNGALFVWNDPEGGEPEDYIPELEGYGSDAWTDWSWNSTVIEGSNCREIVDNVVDMAHFFYIHLNQPLHFRNVFEGHVAPQEMSFKPRADMAGQDYVNFGEESVTESTASYYGPSYMINRLVSDEGLEVVLINCHYPIRPDAFVLQYGVMVKKLPGMTDEQARELADQYGEGTMENFEPDVVIWRSKK